MKFYYLRREIKIIKKSRLLILISLIFVIVIVGCSSGEDPVPSVEDNSTVLKVMVDIPDDLISVQDMQIMNIKNSMDLTELEIKVYEGDEKAGDKFIDDKQITDFSSDSEVAFADDIVVGFEYLVSIEARGTIEGEDEVRTLYTGEAVSEEVVSEGSIVEVEVVAEPLLSESLEVTFGSNVEIETIRLKHPSTNQEISKNYVETLTFNQGDALDNGEELELIPSRWYLEVELENGETGVKEILLLPTQNKTSNLEVNASEGELEIKTDFSVSPDAPEGLELDENNDLVWNEQDNVNTYVIYHSHEDDQSTKSYLATVDSSQYLGPEKGYYWIRAYNDDGYSSKLSNSYLFKGELHNSTDYFNTDEGFGVKYNVTEEDDLDADIWAVSQYSDDSIDYFFTLIKAQDSNGGYFRNSALGGRLRTSDEGITTEYFTSGMPVGNQAHFYRMLSLPVEFYSGKEWSFSYGETETQYEVEYIGEKEINGNVFDNSIKVTINNSSDRDYTAGEGYFILAEGIGIVELVFNKDSGEQVQYKYLDDKYFQQHTISGQIYEEGDPAEGKIVQLAMSDWGNRSIVNAEGEFTIDVYGPDALLRIGDEDGDIMANEEEYIVDNITEDISNLEIHLEGLTIIDAYGTITHTKQNYAEGFWDLVRIYSQFIPDIIIEEEIDGEIQERTFTDDGGGRSSTSNSSNFVFALNWEENNENSVYVFGKVDSEDFAMAVLPSTDENKELFDEVTSVYWEYLEEEIQQIIDESADVIYGETEFLDI